MPRRGAEKSLREKECPARDAKEVGMGNPAEETFRTGRTYYSFDLPVRQGVFGVFSTKMALDAVTSEASNAEVRLPLHSRGPCSALLAAKRPSALATGGDSLVFTHVAAGCQLSQRRQLE